MKRIGLVVVLLGLMGAGAALAAERQAEPGHHTDSVVISCMDFRFRHQVNAWIESELGSADLIAAAGASKCLTDSESQAFILKQIGLAAALHQAKTVVVIDHLDCGAFGGSRKYPVAADEARVHEKHLREAALIIRKSYPALTVKLYLIDSGTIKPIK